MQFSRQLFIVYILLLFLCILVPYEIIAYVFIGFIAIMSLFYLKTNIYFLFVYYPIRPLISEINSGLTFLGDIVIVVCFFVLVYYERKLLKDRLSQLSYFLYFVLFLLVGSIMAILHDVSLLAIIMENRALAIMVLMTFIFISKIWDKKDFANILQLSVLIAFFISIHGIIEKVTSRTLLVPEAWTEWNLSIFNVGRVYGTLANPNVLAMYLLIVFFLSFLPLLKGTRFAKVLPIFQVIILGVALLTASRGSFLAFAVGLLVFFILTRTYKLFLKIGLVFVISLFFVYYPVNYVADQIQSNNLEEDVNENNEQTSTGPHSSFYERLLTMLSEETIQASTEWGRIYIVLKGLEVFKDHPLFGTGFGTFGDAATLSFSSPIYEEYQISEGIYADNQYIHILVSTGIVGTVLLIIFLVQMFRKILPTINKGERIFFISFTLVLLVSCLYYNVLEDKTFMIYYFSILGVLHARSRGLTHA